jgi:hypothetical protein
VLSASRGQYSESQITKARVRAGVQTKRHGFGKGGVSYWFHPKHLDQMDFIESTIETIDSPFQNKDSMDSMKIPATAADSPDTSLLLSEAPEFALQGERQ